MTFRARLIAVCGTLAGLIVLLAAGIVFSPERVQARTSSRPLLPGLTAQQVDSVDLVVPGVPAIQLRRTSGGWETPQGSRVYPASAERISTFLRTVAGLQRASLVSSDPRHYAELGLSADSARLLVLHRTGAPELALLVGKRGPSGDADYVQVRGQAPVYLVRGPLSFYLSQDRPSWYELHVLPDDVQGTTIASVTLNGSLQAVAEAAEVSGGYVLGRPSADKPDQWVVGSQGRPADRVAAGAMASSLANLEGVDFEETPGSPAAGTGRLVIAVTTFAGKAYTLTVTRGTDPDHVRITTSWSPWTYVVNSLAFQRAVLPESHLLAR